MNINNLQQEIPASTYESALEYCRFGRVKNIRKESDNVWNAEILDQELYMMEILIDNDEEVLHWYCDCMYEPGTVCRHVAAFLLHLKSEWTELNEFYNNPDPTSFDLPKIPLTYSEHVTGYTDRIKNIFKESKQQRAGIKADIVAAETGPLIGKAESLIIRSSYDEALAILSLILRCAGESYEDFEDEDRGLANCCNETAGAIQKVIEINRAPHMLPEDFIRDIGKLLMNDQFTLHRLASIEDLIAAIAFRTMEIDTCLMFVNDALRKAEHHDRIYSLVSCKVTLLNLAGQELDIEPLISRYLYVAKVRRMRIEVMLSKGRHREALTILSKGISIAKENGRKEDIIELEEQRLEIYRMQGEESRAIRTLEYLFTIGDSMKYYYMLKSIVPRRGWATYSLRFSEKIDMYQRRDLRYVFARIFIEEKRWTVLLAFMDKYAGITDNYMLDLCDPYMRIECADKALDYYQTHLAEYTGEHIKKENYTFIASILKRMKTFPHGNHTVASIIAGLTIMHSARRNFIKELRSIELPHRS